MDKKKRRKQKGKRIGHYRALIIRGKRKGQYKEKSIREHCLNDTRRLKNNGASKEEIHDFLCNKYHFIDDNPVEDRYLGYIKDNDL